MRVQVRRELEALRDEIRTAGGGDVSDAAIDRRIDQCVEQLPEKVRAGLEARLGGPIRRVLNATGIFLHTNLGRAPLPRQVAVRLPKLIDAYCDLELDLETGERGDRNRGVSTLLQAITGAEGAVVVNNNAAALVLVLAAFALGREVVVSRGELVEIGGSFRIPDILKAAGAKLVEVGTTNRTRASDYEAAIGEETALLLKVHTSNYRQVGFVEAVGERELVDVGRRAGVPVVVDEGSGLLRPHPATQLADHPSHRELLEAGCDLVCGSGDKLLGGPQAGILVGRAEFIERCRRHPLYRALRPNRMTLATLEAVLRMHLAASEGSVEGLPVESMWADREAHRARLEKMAARIGAEIVDSAGFLGGGAAPAREIPGEALALPDDAELLARMRNGDPPVVGYIRQGRLILDLRTIDPGDDDSLADAVVAAQAGS